jgi:myo-inositol-1(or 4)-monophosphatase
MNGSILPLSLNHKSPLEVAAQAAYQAGKLLVDRFISQKAITYKGKGNLVTEVDTLSEQIILDILKGEFPDFKVLSEETNSCASVDGYTWIVDPLDGTNNYVFGVPNFCINIALSYDEDIILGITYDPLRNDLFHTEKGKGAFLNDSKIQISQVGLLKDALLAFDLGYSEEEGKEMLRYANKLWGNVHCIRMMGSSALGLAYVASGRMSIYLHRYLYPWDIASGILLVREAGGKVSDWQGNEVNFNAKQIVATNNRLSDQLLERISSEI